MHMEATTFLVREKGFNSKTFRIQATCLVCRGHIRDQMERLLIPFGPATEEHHRAIGGFRYAHICERDQGPRLEQAATVSHRKRSPSHSTVMLLPVRTT